MSHKDFEKVNGGFGNILGLRTLKAKIIFFVICNVLSIGILATLVILQNNQAAFLLKVDIQSKLDKSKTSENYLYQILDNYSNYFQQVNFSVGFAASLAAIIFAVLSFLFLKALLRIINQPTLLLSKLASGQIPEKIEMREDEFSSIIQASNQLTDNFKKISNFTLAVGEGKFDVPFESINEKDMLGNSLLQMRQKLQTLAEEDRRRNWATEGYAKFADIIRANNQHVKELTNQVLSALIEYLGITQGGIFIVNETDAKEKCMDLMACYAYNRTKFTQKRILIHDEYAESLIGQVYLEKDKILLTDVPIDYLKITSGLGDAPPSHLLIMPLKFNEQVEGVMELASLHKFENYQIEFIEKVCENIAAAVHTVKMNENTQKLLEESQMQSQMLRAQEEEMRQNMEELQSAQENMRKAQAESMQKEANLSALINSTDDSLLTIDRNYCATVINEVLLNRYKGTNYEGISIGTCVLDFLGNVRDEWKAIYDRGLNGEKYNFVMKSSVNKEDSYRHYFINPIKNPDNEVIGISVFSRDVTEQKLKEIRDEQTIEELKEKLRSFESTLSMN